MNWFKILLLVVIGAGVLLNMYSAGKGNRQKEVKRTTEIIATFWGAFLFWGILYWL